MKQTHLVTYGIEEKVTDFSRPDMRLQLTMEIWRRDFFLNDVDLLDK